MAGSGAVNTQVEQPAPADEPVRGQRTERDQDQAAGAPEPRLEAAGSPAAGPGVVPARQAFALVAASLGLMALLRAPDMIHTGEGMTPGRTRDAVLALARPLDRVTRPLGLDWPGERLSALFGHPDVTGASELTATAPPAVGPPPAAAAAPTHPAVAPARVPTVADPLRVLVTGDSLTEELGPTIANTAPPTVRAQTDTRYGTGLVRPDFFDWAAHARQQLATDNPEVVVVALGANDGQGITMPDGTVLPAGSPPWTAEYQRRAEVVLRIWADDGKRRVYWASLPPARSSRLDGYFRQLNGAVAAAAALVPGARFLDLGGQLADHGHYSDYLRGPGDQPVLARTRDGVHYTRDGARIVAAPILAALGSDFRLTPSGS
jgi:hypothetical protein